MLTMDDALDSLAAKYCGECGEGLPIPGDQCGQCLVDAPPPALVDLRGRIEIGEPRMGSGADGGQFPGLPTLRQRTASV